MLQAGLLSRKMFGYLGSRGFFEYFVIKQTVFSKLIPTSLDEQEEHCEHNRVHDPVDGNEFQS